MHLLVIRVLIVFHGIDMLSELEEFLGEADLFGELCQTVFLLHIKYHLESLLGGLAGHAVEVVTPGQIHRLEVDHHLH